MMYFRASNHRGGGWKLHTDPNCVRLQQAKSIRSVPRDQFPDAEICSNCEGTIDSSDQDNSYYNALLEASNE